MLHSLYFHIKKHRIALLLAGIAVVVAILTTAWFSFRNATMDASAPIGMSPNLLDELLSQLPWGNIAYSVPSSVPLDMEADASLRLSPKKSVSELQTALDAARPSRFAYIQIGPRMKATLTCESAGLQITPKNDSVQAISFSQDTIWSWRLVAREPGRYWVHIGVAILLKIDGEDTYRTIESFEDTVLVDATAGQRFTRFFSSYWQWIATTLAVPLLIFLYRGLRAYRQNKREAELEENRKQIGFHAEPPTSKDTKA